MESRQETGPKAEKGEDRSSNTTMQNNKRADSKMESKNSSEIPDRGLGGGASETPGLPSREKRMEEFKREF